MDLPIYNKASQIGDKGIIILNKIISNDLNWILRKNHNETDFGIDGYLDIIINNNQITGKSIAVQVKTGQSYFKEKNELGWIYRDSISHLNYYLNSEIPVLIILVDEENEKAYWSICDENKIEKAGDNWKMTIPYKNEITENSKDDLIKFVSPIIDYSSQLEEFWSLNEKIKTHDSVVILIDKDNILNNSYETLKKILKRLQVNEELLIKIRECIDIGINGYDNDNKELYEIEEVRNWIKNSLDNVKGLSYFLAKKEYSQFINLILFSICDFELLEEKTIDFMGLESRQILVDHSNLGIFLQKLFENLNNFTDEIGLTEETNRLVSENINSFLLRNLK